MLSYNNLEDREKMMKYHRTKDMINLLTFFPEISPILNLTIINNLEDYKENYEEIKNLGGGKKRYTYFQTFYEKYRDYGKKF